MITRIAAMVVSFAALLPAAEEVDVRSARADGEPLAFTWGFQPVFGVRYNSQLGAEGEAGVIVGAHMPGDGRGRRHLHGTTVGLAVSADVSYAGFMYGMGLGAGECVLGGGAASVRLEYVRLDPWRETRGFDEDEQHEGLRLTLAAAGGAGGISASVAYLRDADNHGDHAVAFGIGVGM